MKIFKLILLTVISIILITSLGCEKQENKQDDKETYDLEYVEVYLRIPEPLGPNFIINGNVYQTQVNGHIYEFEKDLSEEIRASFVTAQEELCDYLYNKNSISFSKNTFRVLSDYENRSESENNIGYFDTNTQKSWKQVLTTLKLHYGDFENHGYLYALSNRISSDLGWKCDKTYAIDKSILENDPSLMNLVYPCFAEKYSDSDSISACKALSIHCLDLQKNVWDQTEFLENRNRYAKNISEDFEPSYVTFAYNGYGCPLALKCKYLNVYFDHTFVANNDFLNGYIPKDYTADVAGLIHTFEVLDEHIVNLCKILDVEPGEPIDTQMCAKLPYGLYSPYFETGGIYYNTENNNIIIHSTTVTVLAHEYTHHLYWLKSGCKDPAYELWYNECVAYYLTVAEKFEYRFNVIKYSDPSYGDRLKDMLSEEYDEPEDYIKFLRIAWRNENYEYLYYLQKEHSLCPAFGEYFVRIYGMETFLNSMLHPSKISEYTGKTIDTIVDEWCLDMKNAENDRLVSLTY